MCELKEYTPTQAAAKSPRGSTGSSKKEYQKEYEAEVHPAPCTPLPETLHPTPKPEARNPKPNPETRNPKPNPETPNPKPDTPNPTTRNPKPYTLNPTPATRWTATLS